MKDTAKQPFREVFIMTPDLHAPPKALEGVALCETCFVKVPSVLSWRVDKTAASYPQIYHIHLRVAASNSVLITSILFLKQNPLSCVGCRPHKLWIATKRAGECPNCLDLYSAHRLFSDSAGQSPLSAWPRGSLTHLRVGDTAFI